MTCLNAILGLSDSNARFRGGDDDQLLTMSNAIYWSLRRGFEDMMRRHAYLFYICTGPDTPVFDNTQIAKPSK